MTIHDTESAPACIILQEGRFDFTYVARQTTAGSSPAPSTNRKRRFFASKVNSLLTGWLEFQVRKFAEGDGEFGPPGAAISKSRRLRRRGRFLCGDNLARFGFLERQPPSGFAFGIF